ncbi:Methyltransferase domain [Desmophyllum pertusum]|uniref:Methyltransferase domain n=1 Tax=Desmophyllum pertusum TaxID=174260 RepID=A0A9X0CCT3_9CNID|nr:Methyltransferase domain [Desmophyllum pertusum]
MASPDHRSGYSKYYSGRLSNLTEKSTDDDVRRVYDDWAHEYDKDGNSAGCVFHKPMVEFFDNAINEVFQGKIAKSDIRIMDAGAGTGLVGVELHKHDYSNVDALDISQEMLNEAKKKNVYSKFICAPLSDQRTPGIETDAYDALICVGTLSLAHVRPTAFVEMIRMVRNGGLVCVSIRPDGYKEFSEKMEELEHQGKWTLVKEGRVPHYDKEDMPRECRAYAYTVNKN